MAETIKVLGQLESAAATLELLYTVPSGKQAVSSQLVACNDSATETTVRVSIAVAGAADANKQYIVKDVPIPGNSGRPYPIPGFQGITLGPLDEVRVYATLATVNWTLFGVEVDASTDSSFNLVVKEAGGTTFSAINEIRFVSGDFSVSQPVAGVALIALSIAGGTGSVTSDELSAVSAQAASAINVVSNAVSVVSTAASNALSVANAASNATSVLSQQNSADHVSIRNLISIVSTAASAADAHASVASLAATSADGHANTVSAAVETLSAKVVSISAQLVSLEVHASTASAAATSADGHAATASAAATSVNSRVTSVNTALCALSARSVGDVSTHGLQSIFDALSNRISGVTGGSVTSNELSAVSAQAASAISQLNSVHSVLSDRVTSISAQFTSEDAKISTLSDRVTSISAQLVSLETHASTASAAATSVDGRVTSVNSFISGISARSAGDVSTHGLQSVINALSNRISTIAGGSVTSAEVQTASAAATSVNSRVTSVNAFISGISARSVGDVSTHGFQSVVDALSNQISTAQANVSTLSAKVVSISAQLVSLEVHASAASAAATSADGHANTVSAAVETLSAKVVSISAQLASLEVHASAASAAATSVDSRVNSIASVFLSATGQVVPQVRSRNGVVSAISGGTLVDIVSMSISVAGGALYRIDGGLMWEVGSASGGVGFGLSLPALAAGGTWVTMGATSTQGQNTGFALGRVIFSAVAALNTTVVSVSIATLNQLNWLEINGMIATSAAGTIQIMGRRSAANQVMSVFGGYIRAYRLV